MKILYIAVHSHKGWGSEYWLNKAFNELNIKTELIDYRKERNINNYYKLSKLIISKSKHCDLIFLQRGDKLLPIALNATIDLYKP